MEATIQTKRNDDEARPINRVDAPTAYLYTKHAAAVGLENEEDGLVIVVRRTGAIAAAGGGRTLPAGRHGGRDGVLEH